MLNRQLFIMKIHSARLKDQNYDLTLPFDEAKRSKEIVALADNQILRSIRDMTNQNIDPEKLEQLYEERENIKRIPNNKVNRKRLAMIQKEIDRILYIEPYKIIVIDHPSHYRYIYKNGVRINGKLYRRFSCSAGQARKSNVILLDVELLDALRNRLNNGRNMQKAFSPSKFNAYFGLYGSATKLVSEPRFIVVRDFENQHHMKVNYVSETDWNSDDKIEDGEVDLDMNRTDGMGLISPELSKKWAKELGLSYIPSQWCVRQSFIKGMLCTFPIHQFCEEINNGNYLVETIYKDADGNPIVADLREYDVILSESQFKLWDSYNSLQEYIDNCHKNKLYWGVSQYAPEQAKNKLRLNYQFIQTLRLSQNDVEDLCSQFVEWIEGVSYQNWNYMLLFLLGINPDEKYIREFMKSSDSYWIKALILCPDVKNDKFIKEKIKELLRFKIRNACLGEIFVDGNFQVLVSDPYGFMQHVCGLPVTGLLKDGEFYSNYWNEKGVTQVDSMRSPLTYRSEHVVLNLRKDSDTEKWYRYCKLGIILNYHGHEVVRYAGADFDFDILATTSNPSMIKSVYANELPVYYVPPKPEKIVFTEDDLYKADCFSFGSIIGQITNKSSNAYALLPNLEKEFGINSPEVQLTLSRLKQCCKAQSAQIDKAKIGQEVKGIPSIWNDRQKISDEDSLEVKSQKEFVNNTLLNRHPYFFIYRYAETKSKYKNYVKNADTTCQIKFGESISDLENKKIQTEDEKSFLNSYHEFMPVTISDSPMNLLCRYIESLQFHVNQKVKTPLDFESVEVYKNPEQQYDTETYGKIVSIWKKHLKAVYAGLSSGSIEDENSESGSDSESSSYFVYVDVIQQDFMKTNNNINEIVNILIDYSYKDNPKSSKKLLWDVFGKYIFQNVKQNMKKNYFQYPIPDKNGDVQYLGENYQVKKILFSEEEK